MLSTEAWLENRSLAIANPWEKKGRRFRLNALADALSAFRFLKMASVAHLRARRGDKVEAEALLVQPKILLVTEGAIDVTHGTGVQLSRIFGTYQPSRILHVLPEGLGGSPFDCVKVAKGSDLGVRVWNRLSQRLLGRTVQRRPRFIPSSIEPSVSRFDPDLVLGVVYTNNGLRLMKAVLETARASRAVLWFQDLQLVADSDGSVPELQDILNDLNEIWTLSPLMLEWLERAVCGWPAHLGTEVQPGWCVPVSDQYHRMHKSYSPTFRCIMLGNIWDHRMLSVTRGLWRECQDQMPGLAPMQWICHESGVRRIMSEGGELGPEIEWLGEVAEDLLHETLLNADLAMIPFGTDTNTDYARFSVPSKIGEFAAIGMPMVVLAGSRTATARYVTEYGVSELLTELTQNRWSMRVCEIIRSADERARLSTAARQYADQYLSHNKFRNKILEDLKRAAFVDEE
jgi:hypothetical protein